MLFSEIRSFVWDETFLKSLGEAFTEPLLFVFDPSKRLFFLYLLSSVALAFLTLLFQQRNVHAAVAGLLNKKVWTHPSSRADIQLLVFNSVFRFLLFLFVFQGSLSLTKFVVRQLTGFFGRAQAWDLSFAWVVAVYSVLSFVILDFSRFFQHYLFHKVPFLWRFHKVHHSAEVLTPLTLYRTHPVESLVSSFRRILVVGLVSGYFVYSTQSVIGAYAVFGVNAFDFAFNIFGSNLRHSHIWLSFGPINHLFMSPAQHQIHHSRSRKHFDKNFGFAFSVWDKVFKSFYNVGSKKEFLIFGIRGETHHNFWQALWAPRKP